jgi:proteasome accessory factor A
MSPYATALKVGTTRLVLTLIGEERMPEVVELAEPVGDIKRVSRDRTVLLKRKSGGTITPLEIQKVFLEQVEKGIPERSEETDWVIREWGRTLNDLEHDPGKLCDRIDWAIKEKLFTGFMESEGIDWNDPWLKSLDLEYHNLDPQRGLYRGLEQEESVVALFSEEEVRQAMDEPPPGTRARIRGQAVEHDRDQVKNIHWTGIEFKNGEFLDLTDIVSESDVEQVLDSKKEQFAWK